MFRFVNFFSSRKAKRNPLIARISKQPDNVAVFILREKFRPQL